MKFIDAKFFELGTIQSLFIAQFSIWCVHFNFYYLCTRNITIRFPFQTRQDRVSKDVRTKRPAAEERST